MHLFSQYLFMCFFYSPHSTAKDFSTYLRLGKRLREQFFVPNPQRKQCLQLLLTDSMPNSKQVQYFLDALCGGWGGRQSRGEEWKGVGRNIKNKPHWGLISSKWLTFYKIFRCWQDDPAFEYKEVAPSLTKHRFNQPKQKSGLPSKTNMVFNLCDALTAVN